MSDVSDSVEPDEDELGVRFPNSPSELRQMPDEELFRVFRNTAYSNMWPHNAKVEYEMSARLILAIRSFKDAADRSARTLNVLTLVLVVLTVVLVVYTVRAG